MYIYIFTHMHTTNIYFTYIYIVDPFDHGNYLTSFSKSPASRFRRCTQVESSQGQIELWNAAIGNGPQDTTPPSIRSISEQGQKDLQGRHGKPKILRRQAMGEDWFVSWKNYGNVKLCCMWACFVVSASVLLTQAPKFSFSITSVLVRMISTYHPIINTNQSFVGWCFEKNQPRTESK